MEGERFTLWPKIFQKILERCSEKKFAYECDQLLTEIINIDELPTKYLHAIKIYINEIEKKVINTNVHELILIIKKEFSNGFPSNETLCYLSIWHLSNDYEGYIINQTALGIINENEGVNKILEKQESLFINFRNCS